MARTIAQIHQSIIDKKNADATLAGLTSTSAVSIWRLWSYITAFAVWVLEGLFDFHKEEVVNIIKDQKPHGLQWYITKAKSFQYGVSLPPDTDVYAIVPPVDESVLVVANAAAVELGNLVRIKVAKSIGDVLGPLAPSELNSFNGYMQRIKDAGVRLQCTSGEADNLRIVLAVYYDPLILDADGKRLDGTADSPVKDAINAFLTQLPFNGLFIVNKLIGAIETVEGVRIADINDVAANFAATPYVNIDFEYTPDAGYLVLDVAHFDINVTYTAHGPIR